MPKANDNSVPEFIALSENMSSAWIEYYRAALWYGNVFHFPVRGIRQSPLECPYIRPAYFFYCADKLNKPFNGPLARHVKFQVAHVAGMPGTFSTAPRVSDPDMHNGMCAPHVPWCIPGSLISCFRRWRKKNVPDIPGACATGSVRYMIRGPQSNYWLYFRPNEFMWRNCNAITILNLDNFYKLVPFQFILYVAHICLVCPWDFFWII